MERNYTESEVKSIIDGVFKGIESDLNNWGERSRDLAMKNSYQYVSSVDAGDGDDAQDAYLSAIKHVTEERVLLRFKSRLQDHKPHSLYLKKA